MISVSKLLCDLDSYGELLRYGRQTSPLERRPIVVWNMTSRCNLSCVHCYSDASDSPREGELSTAEAKRMISDLAAFRVPVLLFSGGEPLLREDIFRLNTLAARLGVRTVISTNGTLITKEMAKTIAGCGFDYVGVSLDGLEKTNDCFRAREGAFRLALSGIRNLMAEGQKVGLRFTLTRRNLADVPGILRLVEDEGIQRVCFYHLVYAGRGTPLMHEDITHGEARAFMDLLSEWTMSLCRREDRREVLTVDNHADGIYLYLKTRRESPEKAERILELLRRNGGNGSGITIACIDSLGYVHPDQFWRGHSFGNVRERPFGRIWTDLSNDLLAGLKDRKARLKGRCSRCSFIDACNGNLRARAEAAFGDIWMEDPACYLTEEEISGQG